MRRDLERELVSHRIERLRIAQTRMLGGQAPEELIRRTEGAILAGVTRRGKFLLLRLASADTLMVHRGMTGNLFLRDPADATDAHLHVGLTFDDGREVRICDHRGFGEVRVLTQPEVEALCQRLGPEPLGPDFTAAYLTNQLARRSALVKALLLNQTIVAGLGNIYVDEALWTAQVHPARRANTLRSDEGDALHAAIIEVLSASVERRGTTFSDYKDLYGRPGGHSSFLRVFHRYGEPCLRCGEPIQRIVAAGRGSSICPTCQVPDSEALRSG
jgi:formamidopyrimidine-DNA glycosylase